jgi:hypothetical protein
MRRSGTGLALAALLAVSTGCPKKKGGEADAAAEAAATAVADAAPAGPEATNADAVARFPEETAIDHQAATLAWPKTNVRKAPPSGDVIATLAKGTNVVQLASHDKYVLVTFDDPKNAGTRLMGWVVKDVFSAQPVVHPKGTCPAGQTALLGDAPFCAKVCKVDTDCVGGQACTGTANLALADGGAGDTVHNCVGIARSDAGAPAASDAGPPPAPASVDAGGTKTADAGGGGATGPVIIDPSADGKCPAGYVLADRLDKKCHRACKTSPDCGGPGVICTRGGYCKSGP